MTYSYRTTSARYISATTRAAHLNNPHPEMSTTEMLPRFRATLNSFAAAPSTFHIITTLTPDAPSTSIHVLDSSFNPPTRAHLSLALSASPNARILLLLAIKNADKPPSPAPFEDRLEMMHRFAASFPTRNVDIAITKHSLFVSKAGDIAAAYPGAAQTYPMGFDTLVRVLDARYYTGPEGMGVLQRFFGGGNRVLCKLRGKNLEAQREYLEIIRRGEREGEGCKREWADSIELLEAAPRPGLSSTAVREAAERGDEEALDGMLTKDVKEWVVQRGLYRKAAC